MAKDGWKVIDGYYYCFDETGALLHDCFVTADGQTYYLTSSGKVAHGWLELDGNKYWFGSDARMAKDGWKVIDGYYYCFDADGAMRHDCFVTVGKSTYYLMSNGRVQRGWLNYAGAKYYADSSTGELKHDTWQKIDGNWYYFNSDCKLRVNGYIVYNGAVYVFKNDGTVATGWINVSGNWYYAGSDGKLYQNKYLSYNGKTYYFGSDYKASEVKGQWIQYDGNWYYRFGDGTYAGGWNQIGENWYYFHKTNKFLFVSRWIKTNGKFYYVDANGALLRNAYAPDGSYVNADGVRVSGPVDTKAQGYSSSTGYLILVSYDYHTVNIFTGSRNNWKLNQCFPCSMGKSSTPTPTGTYYTTGKTYSFGHGYTCYYATGFVGMEYLFHSVLYYEGTDVVKDGRLGMNISNGCIRLYIEDAQWIYNNIPSGTTVVIY